MYVEEVINYLVILREYNISSRKTTSSHVLLDCYTSLW